MDPVTRSAAQRASTDTRVTSPLPKEQDQLAFKDEPTMAFEGHASPLQPLLGYVICHLSVLVTDVGLLSHHGLTLGGLTLGIRMILR